MSIEELLKLKEQIGQKLKDKAKPEEFSDRDKFKRENKNQPRMEKISKRPLKRPADVVGVKSENKRDRRDPRFDDLCGEFDQKVQSHLNRFHTNVIFSHFS